MQLLTSKRLLIISFIKVCEKDGHTNNTINFNSISEKDVKNKRSFPLSSRMSERPLRVFVRCPEGEVLPIEANPLSTGASLRSLVKLISCSDRSVFLLFKDGHKLDDEKTLVEQGISHDEEFVLHQVSDEEMKQEKEKKERVQKQIKELYDEIIRIHDVQLSNAEILSQELVLDEISDNEEEETFEINDSVEKYKSDKPSTEPLPMLWDNNSDEEEEKLDNMFTRFSSLEQASTFFRKEGWTW